MSSVPKKQPTILDRISCWQPIPCNVEGCGYVGAIWLPEGLPWREPGHFCSNHASYALARVPESQRSAAWTALCRVNWMWLDVLRFSDPRVLHALRVNTSSLPIPAIPTLHGYRRSRRRNGCYIDCYEVIGFSRDSAEDLDPATNPDHANVPDYHVEPWMEPVPLTETQQEERRLFPEAYAEQDPGWQSVVFVRLAFAASLPNRELSPRTLTWQYDDPSADYTETQYRCEYLNPSEEEKLKDAIRSLYNEGRLGRKRNKTKNWPPGTEGEFLAKVNEKIVEREKDDVTITTMYMLADALAMSKSSLDTMFKRVPEARERYWEHKRRAPRS